MSKCCQGAGGPGVSLKLELAIAAILLAWPMFVDEARFVLHVGVMIALYITLAMSMNLMLRIGQLSLAHGALYGIGAYASAILTRDLGAPFWLAFVLSGLVTAMIALITGPIFMRLKGVHFALLTFAFGEVIVLCFVEFVDLFGGNSGFGQIPAARLGGQDLGRTGYYMLTMGLAAFCYFGLRALYRRELGLFSAALHQDEMLVTASGFEALKFRVAVFVLSAALAGWAGSLFAHYQGYISPDSFGFWTAVNAVIINVLGGVSALGAVVLGSFILVPLPEFLRDLQQYQRLFYGLVLIGLLCFMPRGIAGLWNDFVGRLFAGRKGL
uniref:branched-chain amino acid ABC transporter permease n=1 Tax=Castellaniella defragrans TaxID=75697 RepID=UPI0033422F23